MPAAISSMPGYSFSAAELCRLSMMGLGDSVLLKICEVGNPALRKTARALSVEEIRSEAIQALIGQMRDTMRDAPGVGLAAPQIGKSLQIAVIEDKAEYHKGLTEAQLLERQRVPVDFHVIVNPQIELLSPADVLIFEGCLSVPRLMAAVARSRLVRVTCLDERAEPRVIEAEGWYARILQHEIDHLQGCLYTDVMRSETLTTVDNYQRYGPRGAASGAVTTRWA
ncbi:MAG TPA: peptide deformylase [Steroidobacteraceae bacterium]